jgi:hypothetical protein
MCRVREVKLTWPHDPMCAIVGEVRPTERGGSEVVVDVSELVWEPLV